MPNVRRAVREEAGQHAPADLLSHVAASLRRLLDVDFTAIWGFDPTAHRLYLRAGEGWHPDYLGRATVPVGSASWAGHAFVTGAPVLVADSAAERRCDAPPLLRAHGVVSGLLVPTPGAEGPAGVVGAYCTRPRAFSDGEVRIAEAFAAIVAATHMAVPPNPHIALLSRREREVLTLLAHGYPNREIAARLAVSVKTVETHRTRLARKLHVRTRPALVRFALNAGLVPGPTRLSGNPPIPRPGAE